MVDIGLLDELAANATASPTTQLVDGWLLRAAPGIPFRRASSTVPFASARATGAIGERIDLVEHFYRARGLPSRFQLSPAASPSDLDERLTARGYVVDAPVDILIADTTSVLGALPLGGSPAARVEGAVDLEWAAAYADAAAAADHDVRTRTRIEAYAELLGTIGPRSATAVIELDGEPAGIGLGVLERGWVGIFGMATRSTSRRRGAARAVLRALSQWAHDEHAANLYLQVETDNRAARALYESVGFHRNHSYHYRVLG